MALADGKMGLMVGFNGLDVDGPSGERWELALSLLAAGETQVRLGRVRLYRSTSRPLADGRLHAEIECSAAPEFLTRIVAERDRGWTGGRARSGTVRLTLPRAD